jgi:4-aminobutyrate aminotransferase/(S)-3-amino-2-methylpropionate transaminase
MDAVPAGGLGGTYAGNPVACVAALAAFERVTRDDLLARAAAIGELMLARLRGLAETHPQIGDVRGRGGMVAVEFVRPGTLEPDPAEAARVSTLCHQSGVITLTCGTFGNVLRLLPPLVIGDDLLAEGLDVLGSAIGSARPAG